MSHTLINDPNFFSVTGDFSPAAVALRNDPNLDTLDEHDVSLVIPLTGSNEFSLILECFNPDNDNIYGSPKNFEGQYYQVWVGNEYNPEDHPYSYQNQILRDPNAGFIHLRDINLGFDNRLTQSFSQGNSANYACVVHFKFCKIVVPEISNSLIRITAGLR
jgi:hypothetical protein